MKLIKVISNKFVTESSTFQNKRKQENAVFLVIFLFFIAIIGATMYIITNHTMQAIPPIAYIFLSLIGTILGACLRNFSFFANFHLAILMLAPFAVHILFTNINNAALVILWSMLPPIGAIFILEKTRTIFLWIFAFLLVVLCAYIFRNQITTFVLSLGVKSNNSLYKLSLNLNFIGAATFIIIMLYISRKSIYEYQNQIETILKDLFPDPIAKQLIQNDQISIAEYHKDISIMFIDFTFTDSQRNQRNFSKILHNTFIALDNAIELQNIHKIKTISETYMVGTGFFSKPDIDALIKFAYEVLEILAQINKKFNITIICTIGISSGELIAGIIGSTKKIYDVWGDTVNLASRMATTKYPNEIIISESTYKKLSDIHKITKYKNMSIKGKGTIDIYSIDNKRISRV